jgi:RimJ/RimL family protein N-acetyltransferase
MTDSTPNRIETPRLTLLASTVPLLVAEGEHVAAAANLPRGKLDSASNSLRSEFESLLGAEVASPWPPPLNDDDSRRWMIQYLETSPEPGWGMWYFLLKRDTRERPVAVGNGGYKGPPTRDGTVEIGYSIVPGYQGRGIAREAIAALVGHALQDARVQRVTAETMADNIPSLRVLERNGFLRAGVGGEPGAILLERRR